MGSQSEEKRRARRGVPISGRAAALALQRKEEQKAALAHAKAVEDHKEAVRMYASIKLQRHKEACDAHLRLLLLCHPVELLPPASGILPVVIPTLLPLFKVVAANNKAGALVSVSDGQERYMLDKWTLAKHGGASWPPVYSCFSAFATPMEAISEHFPSNSVMLTAPKVLVQLEAVGQAYYHEKSRKWALSKARVTALLTQLNPTDTLDVHFALNSRDAPTAPLKQHAHPSATQNSVVHPSVQASPSPPLMEATITASPHAHSLPSSKMGATTTSFSSNIGATTTFPSHATTIGAQGGVCHSIASAPNPAAHTTSTVHAAHTPTPPYSYHPQQQHGVPQQLSTPHPQQQHTAPQCRDPLDDHMQHVPVATATHSTGQTDPIPTDSSHAAPVPHPQRCLGRPEQFKPSPRVSVPIERVSPSSSRPSPSTRPAFSLPPRFDSSYRTDSPPFQPPFDSAASIISRPPSLHHVPFNPAAGSHSSRPHSPPPPPALPASLSGMSIGVSSRSVSREPSPSPQPRVLRPPHPQLNALSLQAPSVPTLQAPEVSQAPEGTLPEPAAQLCRPLQHPQASSTTLQHTATSLAPLPLQRSSTPHQPSHMQRHPAFSEKPPHLSWSVYDEI
uniref:Uncharacterized protein n=1 Tax=Dunaliella tertiolecta TaxID=3047 RepID=A0A7S3VSM0_DUNTE|mmetsp:Transcript_18405/g.48001  ORF Transcript_18405/g.48001 Transcript_18405/m.48001 type:complete len:619 (-) Transcript_18405:113-1969(-)